LIRQGRIHEAVPNIQKAVTIFESIENKNRYEILGEAEGYSSLASAHVSIAGREGSPSKRAMSLKAARFWYQKSLGTWQRYRALPPRKNSLAIKANR